MPGRTAPTQSEQVYKVLNRIYRNAVFKHKSILSSQDLNDFQSGFQRGLRRLALSFSKFGDWGILGSITHYIDAIFTEDNGGTGGTSYNNYTYYSHGDSARHTSKTPDFPVYFTDASGDRIYFGHRTPFTYQTADPACRLDFDFSVVAGGTINPTYEYWNGTAWAATVGLVDNTVGFTVDNRSVVFNDPRDNWGYDSLDDILGLTRFSVDDVDRYWVRVEIGTTRTFTIDTVLRDVDYKDELGVKATATPSTSVLIYPGTGMINGRAVRVESIQTLDLSAFCVAGGGGTSAKIIVQINDDGEISGKTSGYVASPVEPECDHNAIKVALITLNNPDITINDADINRNDIWMPVGT